MLPGEGTILAPGAMEVGATESTAPESMTVRTHVHPPSEPFQVDVALRISGLFSTVKAFTVFSLLPALDSPPDGCFADAGAIARGLRRSSYCSSSLSNRKFACLNCQWGRKQLR